MRIAYYSLDEVNRLLVRRWARRQGIRLAYPNVAAIGGPTHGVTVVDLDFIPEPLRETWLSQVYDGAIEAPVLVHGHGLSDDEARELRQRGVTVCQGLLRRRLFREWVAAMSDSELAVA